MSNYIQINNNNNHLLIDDHTITYGLSSKVLLDSLYIGTGTYTYCYKIDEYARGQREDYKRYRIASVGELWAVTAVGTTSVSLFYNDGSSIYMYVPTRYSTPNIYVYHFAPVTYNDSGSVGIKCYDANGYLVFNSNVKSCKRTEYNFWSSSGYGNIAVMVPAIHGTNEVKGYFICTFIRGSTVYYSYFDSLAGALIPTTIPLLFFDVSNC